MFEPKIKNTPAQNEFTICKIIIGTTVVVVPFKEVAAYMGATMYRRAIVASLGGTVNKMKRVGTFNIGPDADVITTIDQAGYNLAKMAWKASQQDADNAFLAYLEDEYGTQNYPKKAELFAYAWEAQVGCGLGAVEDTYAELVNLLVL